MIILDYKDRRPIYEQVVSKLEDLILQGVLAPDEQLPSVRQLAMDLSINPNTIQRAYAELERRGCTYSVKGKGSFVSGSNQLIEQRQEELFAQLKDLIGTARVLGVSQEAFLQRAKQYYEQEGETP